jgi:hypothetical protein
VFDQELGEPPDQGVDAVRRAEAPAVDVGGKEAHLILKRRRAADVVHAALFVEAGHRLGALVLAARRVHADDAQAGLNDTQHVAHQLPALVDLGDDGIGLVRAVGMGHALRPLRGSQARREVGETGLVFTEENGEAWHPEVVSRVFRRAVKRSMLPAIRLHDLRHTHATLALRAVIHPKVVSERLGHATVSITLDTYSDAIPEMQEEAAARIAELLFAAK